MLILQTTNGNQTHACDTFSTHNGKGDPAPLGRKLAGEHTRRTTLRILQKVGTTHEERTTPRTVTSRLSLATSKCVKYGILYALTDSN